MTQTALYPIPKGQELPAPGYVLTTGTAPDGTIWEIEAVREDRARFPRYRGNDWYWVRPCRDISEYPDLHYTQRTVSSQMNSKIRSCYPEEEEVE